MPLTKPKGRSPRIVFSIAVSPQLNALLEHKKNAIRRSKNWIITEALKKDLGILTK